MTVDIKNFYLNTPMSRYEYVRINISDILDEIVSQYKLIDKVDSNGCVYIEVQK